ncbi:hypothetical protein LTR85_005763 [Meristemomyces frigidus]|nr:hypothetical protein LTR85_005763 [Meristemomyces frigidus]
MTTFTNGTSRASASARASRAGSTAREIVKRRDKPYKTEQQRIIAKKRKLDLHTSYTKAPPGFVTLPIGTPDLAERCKELSRQRGLPMNVGHYVKEADLRKQHQKSALAQTLLKFGIQPEAVKDGNQSDTLNQVRIFIKELFPKMPEQDLNEIVRHAWEEGTKRVGNSSNLDLPRRAQLATIARIRHMYTDYDRLLRAFEWKEARSMVEPECLKKLIEWRGETEDDDDDELEEIVRETIVIDTDDEDAGGRASEADDEDSVTEVEPGDASEVEITHHTVSHEDIAAESGIDGRSRLILDKLRPRQRDVGQRNAIAKQKIGAVRHQLRTGQTGPQRLQTHHSTHQSTHPVQPVHPVQPPNSNSNGYSTASGLPVQPDQHGRYAREVIIDGRLYQLKPVERPQTAVTAYQQSPRPASGAYGQSPAANARPAAYPLFSRPEGHSMHEQPVASIERMTPEHNEKRRRVEHPQAGRSVVGDAYRPGHDDPFVPSHESRLVQVVPQGAEVVDLTSPCRLANGVGSSPYGNAPAARLPDARLLPVDHRPSGSALHTRPTPVYAVPSAAPVPYDPRQPFQRAPDRYVESYSQAYPPVQQYGDASAYTNGHPHIYQPPLQLIHGAPASVQQVPPPRQYIPADGAVAPTQYYYPR